MNRLLSCEAQFYTNKLKNLDEMYKFLEKYKSYMK